MDEDRQRQVLEFVETIEAKQTSPHLYSARELMRLPFEIRNRPAQDALERSFEDDVELLETFDEADFHVDDISAAIVLCIGYNGT